MHVSTSVRRAALFAAAATSLATLALTPPASAVPVFVDANTELSPFLNAYTSSGACVTNSTQTGNTDVPVVENGPTASVAASVTATSANGGDTAVLAASSSATGSVKSAGGNPSSLDFAMTGQSAADFALPASGCTLIAGAGVDLYFTFVVTTPGFMHLDFKAKGGFYSEVYLYDTPQPTNYPYYEHYGRGVSFAGKDTVYLPAGSYSGYFEGSSQIRGNVDGTNSGSTSVHATFTTPGTTTVAAAGSGSKYVTLGARSCTAHNVAATVTGAKKTAKKIKQVKVLVNGTQVSKVKKPGKGKVLGAPVADDQVAEVTAEVTLFPKKKGAKAKTYSVSATYEACTL